MSTVHDIAKLAARVKAAKDAYYNHAPLMTDAEYDALEDQLRQLNPTNPVLALIGAAPSGGGFLKVKHDIPMGSLNKAQHSKDLTDWFHNCNLKPGDDILVTDKLDGISVSLRYEKRHLVQGLTRGDGVTGEDITRNVLLMKGAVKVLPAKLNGNTTPDLVFVRGEIVVLKSDFVAHFPGESNPRNTAAGTSKRQSDNSKCRFLTIKAYQLLPDGRGMASKFTELSELDWMGFQTPMYQLCANEKNVQDRYAEYVDSAREALDYDIDGLVIDVNISSMREALGEKNGRPKGAIAFKFPHEEKETYLRNVRWQVGASGRVTPVAEFDVVSLAGANVKQASLHNISNIAGLTAAVGQNILAEGDKILVARRNDVIPYVEAVIEANEDDKAKTFDVPTSCPECNTRLERDGEYLVCRGLDCPAQIAGAIKRWVQKIGVLHCGEALIEALIEAGMVQDMADLYLLDPDKAASVDINGRRAGGSATKAITNLNSKKTLPIHVFVGALGIPLIGRSMAKIIVDAGYTSLSDMLKAHISDIAKIPGVGDTKARSFVEGFFDRAGLIVKLTTDAGIRVQAATGPLVGTSFCLTGFRDAKLTDALEKLGATVKGSVSKKLDYLVSSDPNSQTGKATKARQYGTKVIGIDEANKMAGL